MPENKTITLFEAVEAIKDYLTEPGPLLAQLQAREDFSFAKVVYDSRQVVPNTLFVALKGEASDGHNFIQDALARGASALLVRQDWLADRPEVARQALCLAVTDTRAAFQKLAGWWRARLTNLHVTGITGSVGKTTTKELTANVLAERFRVFKSPKSYNNEYSLMPLILEIQPEHQQAVLEMGCGWELGELRRLCGAAQPHIGVILGVSESHLERMGSIENIARSKAELIESLPPEGWAVLNGDDFRVRAMSGQTRAQVFFYGSDPDFDLWADQVESFGLEGISFRVHYKGESRKLRLPAPGKHNIQNALAASAVGLLCGLSWQEIEAGLQNPSGQVRLLTLPGCNSSTILDDAYNASAVSTLAALDVLADTLVAGRRLALLGDMLELGSYSEEAHRLVGRRAAQVVDYLVVTGELSELTASEANRNGLNEQSIIRAETKVEAAEWLKQNLAAGDLLLVKASRGIALEEVIEQLRAS
ncbi:MAG TPA: UDP-N-acetylmuramoyl-tripeptide--D-alanyl-D-alanine ligase [Chloroflexia bacterium]|nr:UDP-N-acetylmuramoyl-tripeptide--D-alanyl-D-alanine ligase [Chloroflexia bacterium]